MTMLLELTESFLLFKQIKKHFSNDAMTVIPLLSTDPHIARDCYRGIEVEQKIRKVGQSKSNERRKETVAQCNEVERF